MTLCTVEILVTELISALGILLQFQSDHRRYYLVNSPLGS
jgi:hypothetical protein